MADKQATVYIVDQGQSMGEKHQSRNETNLEYGMRYIWSKIAETLMANRATYTVGVIGLRTDDTDNPLGGGDGYGNISVLQPICGMKLGHLKVLQDSIKVNETDAGDAISAIIIAIDMISKFTRKLKYIRKIVLMTDARGCMDDEGIEEVAKKMNEDNIELVVVGVDFDDAEFGFKEEDKDLVKANNEALLKSLVDKCKNGIFGTIADAIEGLTVPRAKETRPYCCYKGQLTLGDPNKYETALCIDIERYFKVHAAKPPSASSFVAPAHDDASAQSSFTLKAEDDVAMGGTMDQSGFTSVKSLRTYKVKDQSAPGGQREVNTEELARGYEYGRTAVHIAASEENVTKLETVKGFSITGFVPRSGCERFFNIGEANVIIAERTNEKAKLALSSFIHALHELDSCAIARIVVKDGADPILLLLSPSIEPDLECLIDVPLPFAEDLRSYKFPPLDRVNTVSGATLTKHRNLPTQELTDAMSAYVDSMDLSAFGRDGEGNPTEYMAIEDVYSPMVHRVNQAIKQRAIQPSEKVGPPAESLLKFSNPPENLLKASAAELKKLIDVADVKKVPPKAKGRRRERQTVAPLSGLDVDSLLSREKRVKISPENAIPEFKRMLSTAEDLDTIKDAVKQMSCIIRSLITHSLGDSSYPRAIANLSVMQEELISMEEPGLYNDFIKNLKERILADDLGGDRREMMWEIRKARLGLIDKSRSEFSDVTESDASEFYSMKGELPFRSGLLEIAIAVEAALLRYAAPDQQKQILPQN